MNQFAKTIPEPACAALGIGSLPHRNPEEALKLVWKYTPDYPHWPQLPRRGPQEHFVYQNLSVLLRLGLLRGSEGRYLLDPSGEEWVEGLTKFYDLYLAIEDGESKHLESFASEERAVQGLYAFANQIRRDGCRDALYFKGQVAGPLSIGLNLTDNAQKSAYYEPQLRDLLVKSLALNARWQAKFLQELGRPSVVFVDDPAVTSWGSSTFITLTREDIIADLKTVAGAIGQADAVAGVHSCAGVDWAIFIEAGFQLISFDAYHYFDSLLPYADELQEFLTLGGVLAWGIVPTNERAFQETAKSLCLKWEQQVNELGKRGVDLQMLAQQALITPSCGTGGLIPELAERVYSLNLQVSQSLK